MSFSLEPALSSLQVHWADVSACVYARQPQILDGHDLIDARGDMTWLLSAQSPIGGISKTSDDPPDVMHSYLSMAALAMHVRPPKSNEKVGIGGTASVDADVDAMAIEQMKEGMDLQETHPALNVSLTSLQWLKQALGKTQ